MAIGGDEVGARRWSLAIGLLALALGAAYAAWRYEPLTYLVGDGPYYALTAVSLRDDGDADLRNQLAGGLQVHGPQVALGAAGEWFPKHPVLPAIVALPFLALFGMPGFLVLNVIVFAGFAAALVRLGAHAAPPRAAAIAALALLFGTFLPAYVYNLSPDLLAALLVACGTLAALEGRDAGAGLLYGAAVLAKPLLVVLLPALFAYRAARGGARALLRLAGGGLLPAVTLLLLDLALFGSPLTTAYDRNVSVAGDTAVLTSHRDRFDANLLDGLRGQLFDPRHGLVRTAPALLLALPGLALLGRRRPAEAIWLLGMGATLFAVLCSYREWASSHYGNRFLMPLFVCATPGLALLIDRSWRRFAARRAAGGEPGAGAGPGDPAPHDSAVAA